MSPFVVNFNQLTNNTSPPYSMCGVMTQLGYLASYATEIFQDLCELADTTHKRVVICTERTRNVLEEIPKVQLALSQGDSSFSEMLQGKQDLVVEQEVVQQLFVATSLPAAIDARYRGGEVKVRKWWGGEGMTGRVGGRKRAASGEMSRE
jgi:hypothetical protein